MKLLDWFKVKKFNLIDAKIFALCGMFIGMILAKLVDINVYLLLILAALLYICIIQKVFKK